MEAHKSLRRWSGGNETWRKGTFLHFPSYRLNNHLQPQTIRPCLGQMPYLSLIGGQINDIDRIYSFCSFCLLKNNLDMNSSNCLPNRLSAKKCTYLQHVLSLFPDSYDSFLGCNQKKSLSALTLDFHSYSYPPLLLYHIRLHHLDQTQVHRLLEEFFCLAIMIGTPSTVHKQNYEMRLRPGEISTVDTRQDNTYRLIRRVIWIIDFDTDTVFVQLNQKVYK